MRRFSPRLIAAIASILLQEAAIALGVIYGLPQFNIHLPWGALAAILVFWLTFSTLIYRAGSPALRKKPYPMTSLVGTRGIVVKALMLDGVVRIRGELWSAKTDDKKIALGRVIIVTKQDGMKLIVRPATPEEAEK